MRKILDAHRNPKHRAILALAYGSGLRVSEVSGQMGFIAVLHTWTQRLTAHYHLHCLVPGGAWNEKQGIWRTANRNFLFGRDALAKCFQARFLMRLQKLRQQKDSSPVTAFINIGGPGFVQPLRRGTRVRRRERFTRGRSQTSAFISYAPSVRR